MSNEYYIQNSEGEKQGPYTHNQLAAQQIALDTLVLPSATNTWQKACDLPELNDYFEKQGYWFPTEVNLASFWWRLLAYGIDTIILTVGFLFAVYFLNIDVATVNSKKDENLLLFQLAAFGIVILYHSIFEATPLRGSLGKKIIGLAVVDANGKRLSLPKALLRNVSRVVSTLPLWIGYFAVLWTDHRQAWHDQIAKTYIIKRDQA
ncbi:hypothetical protein BH09BAC6_BH09BAC6_16110 [soil metagenome]|jgi:uncharacterized RDD family membrane protein YckC